MCAENYINEDMNLEIVSKLYEACLISDPNFKTKKEYSKKICILSDNITCIRFRLNSNRLQLVKNLIIDKFSPGIDKMSKQMQIQLSISNSSIEKIDKMQCVNERHFKIFSPYQPEWSIPEYMELRKNIQQPLTNEEIKHIVTQMTGIVALLHSNGVAHQKVFLKNFKINMNQQVTIQDFTSAV